MVVEKLVPGKTKTPLDDATLTKLIDLSFKARHEAYCPYSHFHVGASLLCEDGTIFTGCNVENLSYGLTVCAERVALHYAVAQGHRRFKAVVICSDCEETHITPCGACRQVLAEFGLDWNVYLTKSDRTYIVMTVGELLPLNPAIADTLKEKQRLVANGTV